MSVLPRVAPRVFRIFSFCAAKPINSSGRVHVESVKMKLLRIALISAVFFGLFISLMAGAGSKADTFVDSDPVSRSFRGKLEGRLLLTGEVYSPDATEIRVPKTQGGQLQLRWMIEDGAEVRVGEKVLEFDSTSFLEAVEKKKIELDGALRDLAQQSAQAEADRIDAKLRLERARVKHEKAGVWAGIPEKLLSKKDYQQYQMSLHRAKVELDKARAARDTQKKSQELDVEIAGVKIRAIRRELQLAEKAVKELVICAPEAGVITVADHPWEGRKFKVGDTVWAGLTVMRMPKLDRMAVQARLFDVDDGRLEPGMKVGCVLDTWPEEVFRGQIRKITPIAQEVGPFSMRRAFDVDIDLERSDPEKMRPGMSVRVEVPQSVPDTHLLVPRWAVERTEQGARIFLQDGDQREVELGPCSAQLCIVKKGLKEGVALADNPGARR